MRERKRSLPLLLSLILFILCALEGTFSRKRRRGIQEKRFEGGYKRATLCAPFSHPQAEIEPSSKQNATTTG
jgi:hypothetical protein